MAFEVSTGGLNPNVDSCAGMIVSKALVTWRRLPEVHKRWIDPDDLVQEGLLEALSIDRDEYRAGAGSKYSTYLFTGLDWRFTNVVSALGRQKRAVSGIVELDAPVGAEDERTKDLPDTTTQQDLLTGRDTCVTALVELLRAVSQDAIIVLVRGLLFGDPRTRDLHICAEIGKVANRLRIGITELMHLVDCDDVMRKKALTAISRNVSMSEQTEEAIRLLECTECHGKFSIAAIREERFFVSSMMCHVCHREMQRMSPEVSCFGKVKDSTHEGYSTADPECVIHCRDRKVCRQFIKSRGETNMVATADDLADVKLDDVKGTSKGKKSKKIKPEKKARAAKPEVEDDPLPSGLPKWPYRRGSLTRWVMIEMLAGVDKMELQKQVEKTAGGGDAGKASWKSMYKMLAKGWAKKKTFTWKLDESGKRYKINDLRYVGPKIAEKAAKPEKKVAKVSGKEKKKAAKKEAA